MNSTLLDLYSQVLPDAVVLAPARVATTPTPAYRDALAWLFGFANYQIKPAEAYAASKYNLDRMRALLARLGSPHEKFESVHIAGTKGKGSTAALCESILRAAGIRTGLYTSPHLHTFRERIRVAGEYIAPGVVVEGIARLRALQPAFPDITVFELMTALAFDTFARARVQVAVVEVGIGGRLDATNVLTPRVAAITSISYDHTEVLGATLAQIAREKAGIIKPHIPVVCAPQVNEAAAVIEQIADEREAPLVKVGRDWQWQLLRQDLDAQELQIVHLNGAGRFAALGRTGLLGAHQRANVTTAIAAAYALREIGLPITPPLQDLRRVVRAGVAQARWQGRFEVLERAPYLIADGAHNRDSAQKLVAALDAHFPNARVLWLFGASADKDVRGMFAELLPRSDALIVTQAHHQRAFEPRALAELARAFGVDASVMENVDTALAAARARVGSADVIVATGSLFVVAEARALVLRARGEVIESDE